MWLRSSKIPAPADPSVDLLVAEYESVRQESIASFHNAQSIIQWSLATYGVLFGAGILALTTEAPPTLGNLLPLLTIVIFAGLLPGLICAAAWQWLGEISRMERVGVYLRGFEASLRSRGMPGVAHGPLGWETFLRNANVSRKSQAPYLGTAAMYFGAVAIALVIGVILQNSYYSVDADYLVLLLWRLWDVLILAVFVIVSFRMGWHTKNLANAMFDFASGELATIPRPTKR